MNEAIQALQRGRAITPQTGAAPRAGSSSPAGDFSAALDEARLELSNHARNRLEHRQIELSGDGVQRLNQAVDQAASRGSKESLVLMDDLAFIVNVQERKIVTALDTQNKTNSVFTKIDSVVLADK